MSSGALWSLKAANQATEEKSSCVPSDGPNLNPKYTRMNSMSSTTPIELMLPFQFSEVARKSFPAEMGE